MEAETNRATAAFKSLPRRMFEIAREGARAERDTHPYINRTFRLQSSTSAAILFGSESMVVVELAMRMQYASYVLDRGYSFFDRIAENTGELIEVELRSLV